MSNLDAQKEQENKDQSNQMKDQITNQNNEFPQITQELKLDFGDGNDDQNISKQSIANKEIVHIPKESQFNKENSQTIFDEFLKNYEQQIKNIFYIYSQGQKDCQSTESFNSNMQKDKDVRIQSNDIPILLRKCLEFDNIQIYKNGFDNDDIYGSSNSSQEVYKILREYLTQKQATTQVNQIQNLSNKKIPAITELGTKGLVSEIQKSIDNYQGILKETQDQKEQQIILSTITALKEQLTCLQKEQNHDLQNDTKRLTTMSDMSSMTKMTKENIRKRNLKYIFSHYSKQQYFAGIKHTFERIQQESNLLNAPKIALFLKDFKITNYNTELQKKNIPNLYKQATNNLKNMNYEEFKSQNNKYPTQIDKVEAFYKYINLDDLLEIKKRCQSQSNLHPFNIKDKDGFRLLPQDIGRDIKLKKMDQIVLDHIKQKKIRDKQKQLEAVKQNDKSKNFFSQYKKNINFQNALNVSQNQSFLNNTNNKSFINSGQSQFEKSKFKYTYENYSQRKVANQEQKSKQKQVYSWAELEKSSFKDIKINQVGSFRPEDLIEETEDEEDEIYLKQFQLDKLNKDDDDDDNNKGEQKQVNKQINLDNYGIVREKIRPTQQYLMQSNPNYDPNQKYIPGNRKNYGRQNHSVENIPVQQNAEYVMQNQTGAQLKQRNLTGYSSYNTQNSNYNNDFYGLNRKQNSISQQYLKRAHQLEGQYQTKQKAQIERLYNQQNMKASRLKPDMDIKNIRNSYSYVAQNTPQTIYINQKQ
ncbi:hypothetical protein PPERSA_09923 [Pseudocohnilembus persalinus]|uniref:Uncharacterized protein n=1 Tax=Pseudocohnilembus persalinus TaxID=266149 RepID=A0A0V0QJ92_PSEPJ|nr:hypothetical protein PPERSA_09923 [Pseudocohnilembus persalinus]|eukprot:KRX02306.1 hypothetical protein PPERSA_09923 [Pseudocohnilembus persalinus]